MSQYSGPRLDPDTALDGRWRWLLIPHGRAHVIAFIRGGFRTACGRRPRVMADGKGPVLLAPGSFLRCESCARRIGARSWTARIYVAPDDGGASCEATVAAYRYMEAALRD